MLGDDLKTEFDALLPGRSGANGASRRTALKAALGVGYAAAAGPILAQTAINTPATGLTVSEISYEVNGFKDPVDIAAGIKAPVLGLYGGADPSIPQDSIGKMKTALATGGPAARASQFVVYPGAPHAFHADYRPSYRPLPAADGFKRTLEWLKAHGAA